MPIADLILQQISDAGFAITVMHPVRSESEDFQVIARELATGLEVRVADPSLIMASTKLADQLGVYCKLGNEKTLLGYRVPLPLGSQRVFPLPAVLALTLTVFMLDLVTPGLNLGVLYIIPLILARRSRLNDRELLLYTSILMCLTFADHLVDKLSSPGSHAQEPSELLNRSLVLGMIASAAGFILLYRGRQLHAPYRIDKPAKPLMIEPAPPVNFALKDQMADRLSALLIGFIFVTDVTSPQPINVAILYLIPLALLAIAYEYRTLWKMVALLLGLTFIGYLASPSSGINTQSAHLIVANRGVVGGAILLSAIVLQIRSHAATLRVIPS